VTLSREECIGLMQAVSKSGIDFFELKTGGLELLFNRSETAPSAEDVSPQETGGSAVEVLSPVLGICRTAPGDGAPPYVRAGQKVSEGDIICSLDVLEKRFEVQAGARGTVARLDTRDGALVEYGQRLAAITGDE